MRKVLLMCSVILLIGAHTVCATPMIYTFEGNVSVLYRDDAGIIGDLGITTGMFVTHTFLVDIDEEATRTLNNGVTHTLDDSSAAQIDRFYVDQLAGTMLLQEKDGGYFNGDLDLAQMNEGYMRIYDSWVNSSIYGGSSNHYNYISSDILLTDWVVGTNVTGTEGAYASDGTNSMIYSDLMITSITPGAPVPEPATLFLLGSGLAGLLGFRKKFI